MLKHSYNTAQVEQVHRTTRYRATKRGQVVQKLPIRTGFCFALFSAPSYKVWGRPQAACKERSVPRAPTCAKLSWQILLPEMENFVSERTLILNYVK